MIVESYEDVVKLSGRLRSNFWETIHTAIALTLRRHPTGVIVDCSGIDEVTTEGADTFYDAIRFVGEHDEARIILAAVPPHMAEVLKHVPNVRSQLPVVATVEEARRSLDLLLKGETEGKKKKKDVRREYDRLIIACLAGDAGDAHLFRLVVDLIDTVPAKVLLLYPILVPRDKPVTAPLPQDEERAAAALEAGATWMTGRDIPSEIRIDRGRDLATVLNDAAEETGAVQVVLSVPELKDGDDHCLKTVAAVIERVKAPLVMVRAARG